MLDGIRASGVAIYHWAGWYDSFPRDALVCFAGLPNPQKIAVGPWSHRTREAAASAALVEVERLRWFDYWLRGIDNGMMDEPLIHYATLGAAAGEEWRSAREWPLPGSRPVSLHFHGEKALSAEPPREEGAHDEYVVDYTATSGTTTRWDDTAGGRFEYGDMAPNDAKGMAYTTPALERDVEVTGHPVVHLWVCSTAEDGDFFAYLEEVDADGVSHYVSEGSLRASHRATARPPHPHPGLPYHRSFREDVHPLPTGEPVELVFDLLPTSRVFPAGSRIRVNVTCADADNTTTPRHDPPPVVTLYRGGEHLSRIVLPVVPPDATR